MNIRKIAVGWIAFSTSALAEETISSETAPVCQHDPSQCDCSSSKEFENLQDNLDSCLRQKDEDASIHEQAVKDCEENKRKLGSALEEKIQVESSWIKEKAELEAIIAEQKKTIDANAENEKTLSEQNADLQAKLASLETDIKAMNGAKEEVVAIKKSLSDTTEKVNQCHQTIDELDIKYQDVRQQLNTAESKQEEISSKHNQKVKDLRAQIATMNKELENQKRVLRSTQDRFHDTSEKLTQADRELRTMHIKAQQTYVNTTLVKEHTMHFISKNIDKAIILGEDFISHSRTQDAYSKVKDIYSKAMDLMQHAMEPIMPYFNDFVVPQFMLIEKNIKKHDAVEGARRLIISIVEKASTVALNYIELTKSNTAGTRRLQNKVIGLLKYVKDDAEYVVDIAMRLFMFYLGYKIIAFVLRSFLSLFRKKSSVN